MVINISERKFDSAFLLFFVSTYCLNENGILYLVEITFSISFANSYDFVLLVSFVSSKAQNLKNSTGSDSFFFK